MEENGRKWRTFWPTEQLCKPKCLEVTLNIAGVEKYARKTCGCDQHWRPFDWSLNEMSISDGGNLSSVVDDSRIILI